MVAPAVPPSLESPTALAAGTVLLHRGDASAQVLHLMQGRVVLGLWQHGEMLHQLGEVDGPCWLEVSSGLLGLPHAVDAVALTPVQLEYVAASEFLAQVDSMPVPSQIWLMDMARAQRRQTELALSRLTKDADARCAEWLLRHAEPDPLVAGWVVTMRERKRSIAAQLGMAPETFSRVLRHLRERQLISGGGRVLGLPNPQALRELAGV